jgi:hypothetical protein
MQFIPGETSSSLRVLHLISDAWHWWYVHVTTQPVIAKRLEVPRQVFNQLAVKSGVLLQAITDCASFTVSTLPNSRPQHGS